MGGREVREGEWLERYDGLRGLSGLKGRNGKEQG